MTDCWVLLLLFICFSEDCLLVGTKPGHLLLYRIKNNAGKINKYLKCLLHKNCIAQIVSKQSLTAVMEIN